MARKDVIKEFKSIEDQYLEMVNTAKDYDEALADKFITQDQYEYAQDLVRDLKLNYDRWAFIIYLLNQPAKKSKKARYDKENATLLDYLEEQRATVNATIDEGADCLKNFKKFLDELKEKK